MYKVVGVEFKKNGRLYYFAPGKYDLHKNITVIVETERGIQLGTVATDTFEIEKEKIKGSLKKVIRIASKDDYYQHKKNIKEAQEALKVCQELTKKENLNMKIIDASYTFDKDQLVFHFVADNRIDFRNLAKQLASIYHTRIELRQVGVRDKAREIGGIGTCGHCLCCSKFLNDFDSVSINMAKNQNLSLNPNKINGVCGRLLCCLKYEDDIYSDCRKCLPEVGSIVKTEQGKGKVISVDVLKKSYRVDLNDAGIIEVKKSESCPSTSKLQ